MFKQEKLIKMLRKEMQRGEKLAFDRKNNILPDLALRKTSRTAEWFADACPVCNDSFREDDLVRICPNCNQAYHDDAAFNLKCWAKHFSGNNTCSNCGKYSWNGVFNAEERVQQTILRPMLLSIMEEQFFAGLVSTWKTYGEARITLVKPGSHIIGHNCPICRYKIREGDRVVKCPCSDHCHVYFHNDVLRKWTCWNEWNGEQGKNYCPISSKEYREKTKFKKVIT